MEEAASVSERMTMAEEATRRYLVDAVFHHRVYSIVERMQVERAVRFDDHDRALATESVACALLAEELAL
jgi:hypothetical protein